MRVCVCVCERERESARDARARARQRVKERGGRESKRGRARERERERESESEKAREGESGLSRHFCVHWHMLQRVAVCCSELQCVAVCYRNAASKILLCGKERERER